MMRIAAILLWLVLGFCFAGGSSMAANWGFLKDTPISNFTKEDMQLFTDTLKSGLDHAADGAKVSWSNTETGAGGTLTFLATREQPDTVCRQVQIANKAKGRQGNVIHIFCRNSAGEWKARQ